MGIKDTLIRALGGTSVEQKNMPMGGGNAGVVYQTVGTGHNRKTQYKDYAEEGYSQNAIVYRCVNEIAQGAASIPFKVKLRGEDLEAHPALNLLYRPNPLQAHVEYFHALYSYLLISGNSYALKVGNSLNGVSELHLFRPDRVNILPSNNYIPKGYEYKINGKVLATYDADPTNGMSEVKHFKMWNPTNDYYGMSPIYAASADIDLHNLIARHNVNLMNNGARPTGAVVFNPKDMKSGMSVQLSVEQRKQIMTDLDQRFAGVANSGKTMLLEGDFDWKEMGLSPKDMDFVNAKNMSARDIALCFGVPAQLVGIPDSQTYANMAEARLALYEETIIPLARRIESDLNEWLMPEFGDELYFEYDIDEIPAIAERRKRVYENVVSGVREGILTRNEARERLGLGEVEGGDDIYINASLFPLGSAKQSPVDQDTSKAVDVDEMYDEIMADGIEEADELDSDTKAESDVDTKPTQEMAQNAIQALAWRSEFGRGGTEVGVARARQLKNRDRLSPDTVRRMNSYFARHEVDKEAEGFRKGEKGFPSAGRVAWDLWGGDAGQSWAARKVKELNAEKSVSELIEDMAISERTFESKAVSISEKIKNALKNKVDDHNEKYGDDPKRKVTLRMLEAVFRRGVGAYHSNPESVRPTVTSPDQWGLARVNVFLRALRTNRFPSGRFDTDLMPEGHPLSSKD